MANTSQELSAQAAQINRDQLGEKTRVHALAKMLGVSSAEMVSVLTEQGIEGKRPASTVTKQQIESVLDALAPAEKAAPKKSTKKAAKKTAKKAAKKTAAKKTTKKSAAKKSSTATKKTATKAEAAEAKETEAAVESAPVAEQAEAGVEKKAEQAEETTATKDQADNAPAEEKKPARKRSRKTAKRTVRKATKKAEEPAVEEAASDRPIFMAPEETTDEAQAAAQSKAKAEQKSADQAEESEEKAKEKSEEKKPRRRRVRRVVRRFGASEAQSQDDADTKPDKSDKAASQSEEAKSQAEASDDAAQSEDDSNQGGEERRSRRRRRSRGRRGGKNSGNQNQNSEQGSDEGSQAAQNTKEQAEEVKPENLHPAERDEADIVDEPVRLKGSTRLESRRKWRQENRREPRHIVSRGEFLARRESVERKMVVRDSERTDKEGLTTQVGVVEDGMLVEHFVTSETQSSIVGNIYLGTVQNVLGSMEAAFIDIGTGRNAVLYAGEMNWHSPHLHTKARRIEQALKAGDQIMVQVIKDPVGHKGARLTGRISFAGRYLVYFPGGTTAGISRKLPEGERKRLKDILTRVVPGEGGAIIRTAAENVEEERIGEDVERLHRIWEGVEKDESKARNRKGAKPITLYEEPNMLVKVVRDIFNEDFTELIVDGEKSWATVRDYVGRMAPDLKDRVIKWHAQQNGGQDVFAAMSLDEQLSKALSRKVWLPSGGHLVFDHTEAMTVIDVNTGSFIGAGGNLEETVTQNNLEAAEEIVRQMRLRDLGGMIVVDFIDMVLEENQDLVLRRLTEFLGRDRTRHKVSEVTSLGLVQMTRKRLGIGLLDTFSTVCEHCGGRGVIVHADPVEDHGEDKDFARRDHGNRKERQQARREQRRREEAKAQRASAEVAKKVHAASSSQDEDPADESQAKAEAKTEVKGNRKGKAQEKSQDKAQSAKDNDRRRARRRVKSADHTENTERSDRNEQVAEVASENREEAQKPSGGRRRVRRVVRRHNAPSSESSKGSKGSKSTKSSASADRAAARRAESKREQSQQDSQSEDREQMQKDEAPKRGRRRVRRVVRSHHEPVQAAKSEQTQPEKGLSEKGQTGQSQPEKKAGEKRSRRRVTRTAKTYEEAKREFESSPRRKRNTRGNSRSDVAPRPEDFAGDENPADNAADKGVEKRSARTTRKRSSKPAERVEVASEEKKAEPTKSQGGKRRVRRVVRRSH